MQFGWRRLHPGETDVELLAAIVLGSAILIGGGWLVWGLPAWECQIYRVTGIPCITCGGTRACRALLSGNFLDAFGWNPLVAAGAIVTAIYGTYAAIVCIARLPRLRVENVSQRASMAIRCSAAALLAANWIYLIARFST